MSDIQEALSELQRPLVPDFAAEFDLRPLQLDDLRSLVRASGHAVSSAFLPLFVMGSADLVAVHLAPGKALADQAWVLLPHDEFSPEIIASDLKGLIRVAPVSRLAPPTMGAAQWEALGNAALLISETTPLEEAAYTALLERLTEPELVRAELDPSNVLEAIGAAMARASEAAGAIRAIEDLGRQHPADPFALCFKALVEQYRCGPSAPALAELALLQELPWSSSIQGRWLSSWLSPEILLDKLRNIVLESGSPSNELRLLTKVSFLQPNGAAPLADVARGLARAGRYASALAVARNGMLLALHEPHNRARWYGLAREISEQAHPDSLISAVAMLFDEAWEEGHPRADRSWES